MSELAFAVRVLVALVFLSAALGKARHRAACQGVLLERRRLAAAGLIP